MEGTLLTTLTSKDRKPVRHILKVTRNSAKGQTWSGRDCGVDGERDKHPLRSCSASVRVRNKSTQSTTSPLESPLEGVIPEVRAKISAKWESTFSNLSAKG